MHDDFDVYLKPTAIIDSDHPRVMEFARSVAGSIEDPVEQAVRLYLAVRDGIRYDPYAPFHLPEHYRASWVMERGRSFCIPKASLLIALGRSLGIPGRVGFATVRNHLSTKQLNDYIGSNVFVYHAFVEFHLEGKWVKCTPAFNRELCEKQNVPPLEFNGREDSLFQAYNRDNDKFMEYVEYSGSYADIPVTEIVEAWRKTYGDAFIEKALRDITLRESRAPRDFENEDVLKE